MKKKSEEFDKNWNFVHEVVFAETHPDFDTSFKGHLWVKELFLIAQLNGRKVSAPLNMLLALIIAGEWIVVKFVFAWYERRHKLQNHVIDVQKVATKAELAYFYVPLLLPTFLYAFFNLLFLNMALVDIKRRNSMMQLLSNALEVNF